VENSTNIGDDMPLITRVGKGSPLTNDEMDSNLLYLDFSKVSVGSSIFWQEGFYKAKNIVQYENTTYINNFDTSAVPGLNDEWIAIAGSSGSSATTLKFTSETLTVSNGKIKPKRKPRDGVTWSWLLLSNPIQPLLPGVYSASYINAGTQYNGQQINITYMYKENPFLLTDRSKTNSIIIPKLNKVFKEVSSKSHSLTFRINAILSTPATLVEKINKDIVQGDEYVYVNTLDYLKHSRGQYPRYTDSSISSSIITYTLEKKGGILNYGTIAIDTTFSQDYGSVSNSATETRIYGGLV
jgi:hypothetical protein